MTTTTLDARTDICGAAPAVTAAMSALDGANAKAARAAGLEPELLELVKLRASQINGCSYCLNMHSGDARKLGVTEQRLYLLEAWRETTLYSDRERAALALTEAVTRIEDGGVPDEVYRQAAEVFDEAQLALVVWSATLINAWNRVSIASRYVISAS
jgi:AhpD family alkylhydroperoxidase